MKATASRIAIAWLITIATVIYGCASLGLPTAETFNQRWAVTLTAVTQVRNTTTQLLVAKKITADDAQNLQQQCDTARAGLDIARKQSATDLPAANTRLELIANALRAVEVYLAARGA